MYSADSFTRMCENYIKTPSGQRLVAQRKDDIINGKASAVGSGIVTLETMKLMGQKMKDILYGEIVNVIPSFDFGAIEVSEPQKQADGNYGISISISSNALHRDSLWQEGYPNGVDNIVPLFEKGWSANNSVYGEWHGKNIKSRVFSPPNNFMQQAVDVFNSYAVKGAKAELGDAYK